MTRQLGHMRVATAYLLVAVLLATVQISVTHAAAASSPCRVRNVTQDTRDNSFRRMVRAAHRGDRLRVRGTCSGGVTIRKSLVIRGVGPDATLSGRGRFRVLTIEDGRSGWTHVRLRDIRIVRGRADLGGGVFVIGAELSLTDSTVAGNTASHGGGITVGQGVATLRRTVVYGNTARELGGGIWAAAAWNLTLIDSVVRRNRARQGGGIDNEASTVILVDSAVHGNRSAEAGGGIHNLGELRLLRSRVRANSAGTDGGGIHSETEEEMFGDPLFGVDLVGSTVTRNTAAGLGGGILFQNSGSLAPVVLNLVDSAVSANRATVDGGGVYAVVNAMLSVTVSGSTTVTGNDPNDCVGTPAC